MIDYLFFRNVQVQLARAWSFKEYNEYVQVRKEGKDGMLEPLLKKELLTNAIEDVRCKSSCLTLDCPNPKSELSSPHRAIVS